MRYYLGRYVYDGGVALFKRGSSPTPCDNLSHFQSIETLVHFGVITPVGITAFSRAAGKDAWKTPNEVKQQFRNASILKGGRAVFNIAGNEYRLVVAIEYVRQVVFVRFIGTHAQYDQINAETV